LTTTTLILLKLRTLAEEASSRWERLAAGPAQALEKNRLNPAPLRVIRIGHENAPHDRALRNAFIARVLSSPDSIRMILTGNCRSAKRAIDAVNEGQSCSGFFEKALLQ